jgi:hypothetical protein
VSDIIVTWPKSRAFASYMAELEIAKGNALAVSFRVPTLPSTRPERCYRVHDGEVRGWLKVLHVARRTANEVTRVGSDRKRHLGLGILADEYWPAGIYVTCDPEWHPVTWRAPMRGFQGWRWFDRNVVADA